MIFLFIIIIIILGINLNTITQQQEVWALSGWGSYFFTAVSRILSMRSPKAERVKVLIA